MRCPVCQNPAKHVYCSLSCSNTDRKRKNADSYYLSPKLCLYCQLPIRYEARHENTFCSRSCRASFCNRSRGSTKKEPARTFCRQETKRQEFALGLVTKRRTLRKLISSLVGPNCSSCGQPPSWVGLPLTMTVDHLDGDAGNNLPANLRLLCPNCHSQTPTFCGRNLGRGRQARNLPKS